MTRSSIKRGLLDANGRLVDGWQDDYPCDVCGAMDIYYQHYDAFFCPSCNEWREEPYCMEADNEVNPCDCVAPDKPLKEPLPKL
jgi:hypothetical protein